MLLKPDDTPDLQGIVATACEVLYRGVGAMGVNWCSRVVDVGCGGLRLRT